MEEKIITIGHRDTSLETWRANQLSENLGKIGISSRCTVIDTEKSLSALLQDATVDIVVYPLSKLPFDLSGSIVVAGVSSRAVAGYTLLIHKESVDMSLDLRLKNGSAIATPCPLLRAQLEALREGVTTEVTEVGDINSVISMLEERKYSAVLASSHILDRDTVDFSDYQLVNLHPMEVTPTPAQAISSYITRKDDITLRKYIAKVSHRDVAECANIERKTMKILDIDHRDLGVHCTKDHRGNYHAYGSTIIEGKLHKVSLSRSTTYNLAEDLAVGLKK